MTTLAVNQVEVRADDDAALVIGEGTDYPWTEDGPAWWGAPDVRTSDVERAATDGVVPGRDLLGTHATTVMVNICASSAEDLGEKIDAWKAACASAKDSLVTVRISALGQTRRRRGRFRIPGDVTVTDLRTFTAQASAQFVALDPITYGDDVISDVTGREVPGVGVTIPFTVPFTVPASEGGALGVTVAGNRNGPWVARLDGPLSYPEVSHTQSGRRLFMSFDANGGVVLADGDYLVLDSAARSVLLNGTADRRTQLTLDSLWWDIVPGQNDFVLRADDGTGTLTVSTRDAWHS